MKHAMGMETDGSHLAGHLATIMIFQRHYILPSERLEQATEKKGMDL